MARANPKAWFTSPIARITYRSVDKQAHYQARFRPFFPTWQGAHGWMLSKARDRVRRIERDLASAKRHLSKIEAMAEPSEKTEIED